MTLAARTPHLPAVSLKAKVEVPFQSETGLQVRRLVWVAMQTGKAALAALQASSRTTSGNVSDSGLEPSGAEIWQSAEVECL